MYSDGGSEGFFFYSYRSLRLGRSFFLYLYHPFLLALALVGRGCFWA